MSDGFPWSHDAAATLGRAWWWAQQKDLPRAPIEKAPEPGAETLARWRGLSASQLYAELAERSGPADVAAYARRIAHPEDKYVMVVDLSPTPSVP